jgi:hypothetical protein
MIPSTCHLLIMELTISINELYTSKLHSSLGGMGV